MSAHLPTTRPGTHAKAGIALTALGVALLGLMVAFPERLKVPAAIGYLTAGTLALAGLLALANAYCGRQARDWLAVALLSCMTLPSAWIAFGPGQRTCSARSGLGFHAAGDLVCRAAFGIESVLGVVLLLVAVRRALAGRD